MTDRLDNPRPDDSAAPDTAPPAEKCDSGASPDSEPVSLEVPAGGPAHDPGAEKVLWVGRTSWKNYAGRIALWALGSVLFGALLGWLAGRWDALSGTAAFWIVLAVIALTGAFVAARVAVGVLSQRFRLTNERLFVERGLLSRSIDQTELIRVDDVRVYKSPVNLLCRIGTVEVLSTDVSDGKLRIEGIEHCEQVAEAIRKSMRALRKRSLYVENL